MATSFKTLKEYFYPNNGNKKFVIPNYQRGYKWSVQNNNEPTSVEYLMESLINSYKTNSENQFFLQGVTVVEEDDNIILIDGQQRTTTLYLILWSLGIENITGKREIILEYTIREKSKEFIHNLKNEGWEYNQYDINNENQDVFYFKKAIEQIKAKLESIDKNKFLDFLMNKVSLLYIVIEKSKAVSTFTMMNGHKATMHDEELIKAELLHLVSLPTNLKSIPEIKSIDDTFIVMREVTSIEWETNSLRSKYAREWDKWLYWWNRDDVKDFFNTTKPMGHLLEYFYKKKNTNKEEKFTFNNFKKNLLPDNNKQVAKEIFKGLRDLQKDFEDIFNNPLSFNYLKCSLICSNDELDKFNIIMYFISQKHNNDKLEYYSKWRMLGSTHIEIIEDYTVDPTLEEGKYSNKEKRKERADEILNKLSDSDVYNQYKDILFIQFLRLNVNEYNKLNSGKGVKFDFSIWKKKSIEHIYPKSCFYHIETDEHGNKRYKNGAGVDIIDTTGLLESEKVFKQGYSEHCIGNLVLLYGKENSEFGAKPFIEKKKIFFNNERTFDSRNLLHTISSFASSTWEIKDIEDASKKILNLIKNDYNE